ncbi:sugar ABC transporter ATP-binding protein [Leucobacter chironomi]|uniref:sugar ABC transporter ATP-binding protein n=1 Tax=Leucobacter chironomi TaxID=491918 RepID=UPI000412367E|nr:sugar ABC transporter ATP-binding protein [Leucobacter chironomi]
MAASELFAELHGIVKRFGGVTALNGVSVAIQRGTVHSFIGENGAGKSTLGKILAGAYRPDAGRIVIEGVTHSFAGPHDALEAGIATIQQEIALVPGRTVIENVFLGREASVLGFVKRRQLLDEYRRLSERTGFDIAPQALVRELRIADQQKVEIMRAVARKAELIILDEPTAALTPEETENLMNVISGLKIEGVTVVFVSHYLEEVLAISDTITILRNGEHVRTGPAAVESKESLIQGMLGKDLASEFPERRGAPGSGEPVLEVRGLSTPNGVVDVGFEVRRGEIVGVAGLVGAGRSELLAGIFGADLRASGEVLVDGAPTRVRTPRDAIASRIALIPEDRKASGLFLRRSLRENISLASLRRFTRLGWIRKSLEARATRAELEALDIRPAIPEKEVGLLSGGNQQKALFAKWLATDPRVLLVDEPTRGVDVGAKFAIYEILTHWVSDGRGMVVVSSDVEELLGLADRILVLRHGRVVAAFARDEASKEKIMAAAFGAESAALEGQLK